MKEFWRSRSCVLAPLVVCCLYLLNSSFCWSLNDEGLALLKFKEKVVSDPYGALSNWNDKVGVETPCSWSGIECVDGFVEVLNLKDLCLRGTLAPDIGNLVRVKSIILRNNSFSGIIPEEIANLNELEVLDLGYNNFSGQIPCRLGNNFSMAILLLDNNELLDSTNPEIYELQKISEVQVEERLLSGAKGASYCNSLLLSWNSLEKGDAAKRKLLQVAPSRPRRPGHKFFDPIPIENFPVISPSPSPSIPIPSPSPSPSPGLSAPPSSPSPASSIFPPPLPIPEERRTPSNDSSSSTSRRRVLILSAAIGGPILIILVAVVIFICKSGKVATVKPWATGLSGQLQRAFVTGVPKLKRAELVAACEDFSNVIGSSSYCTLYKGTLSSGVEIAVASIAVGSAKDWSSSLESQFRKKIETLSKVNHKNFVSLLGYCEENDPFTRMMVFEYAPNGTLFEHLHIREAEHLDWTMRLRIAMGMAYCLEHMHQLTPPLAHRNLTSSSVYLTEDYAAKISDFVFWGDEASANREQNLSSNVYSFGVVLFEIITGKLPYSAGSDSLEDWASDYLRGEQPLRERVDPTLRTYSEDQLQQIGELIKSCADPEPRRRPNMRDVCTLLRDITGIGSDGAVPKLSPLWWAELEIQSTEAA